MNDSNSSNDETNMTPTELANSFISELLDGDKRKKNFRILKYLLDNIEKDRIIRYRRILECFYVHPTTFRTFIKSCLDYKVVIEQPQGFVLTNSFVNVLNKRKDEILEFYNKNFDIKLLSTRKKIEHLNNLRSQEKSDMEKK